MYSMKVRPGAVIKAGTAQTEMQQPSLPNIRKFPIVKISPSANPRSHTKSTKREVPQPTILSGNGVDRTISPQWNCIYELPLLLLLASPIRPWWWVWGARPVAPLTGRITTIWWRGYQISLDSNCGEGCPSGYHGTHCAKYQRWTLLPKHICIYMFLVFYMYLHHVYVLIQDSN